jgi:hypothetical protein
MAVCPSDLYVRVLITGTHFGMGLEYDRGKLHHPMPTSDRAESLSDSPKTTCSLLGDSKDSNK